MEIKGYFGCCKGFTHLQSYLKYNRQIQLSSCNLFNFSRANILKSYYLWFIKKNLAFTCITVICNGSVPFFYYQILLHLEAVFISVQFSKRITML